MRDDKGWLSRRIAAANSEVASWPSWMKRSAHFEGTPRDEEERSPAHDHLDHH